MSTRRRSDGSGGASPPDMPEDLAALVAVMATLERPARFVIPTEMVSELAAADPELWEAVVAWAKRWGIEVVSQPGSGALRSDARGK